MNEKDFIEEEYIRICNVCGKEMWEGYCLYGGEEYYCSEECLNEVYTDEEWEDISYSNDDCYWSEWCEDYER